MSGLNDPRKGYALVAPATMLIILGLAAPILFMVLISFWTQTNFDLIPSFSTENYERIFERGTFTALFLKTVGIASLVTIITVVLSFPVAYFIAFRVERRKILWLDSGLWNCPRQVFRTRPDQGFAQANYRYSRPKRDTCRRCTELRLYLPSNSRPPVSRPTNTHVLGARGKCRD